MKSRYAALLNALDEMQQSLVYAVRRSVLAEAEQTIVSLEKECASLRGALREYERSARDVAAEASWKERQGDDYGSY